MKKFLFMSALLTMGLMTVSQAQAYEPWSVSIYSDIKEPLEYAVPGATLGHKVGEGHCKTVLGIVNWGDCSVKAAMKNGNITKVTSADWEKKYVIVYGRKTLKVYGN